MTTPETNTSHFNNALTCTHARGARYFGQTRYTMRVNQITTAAELDRIWAALLVRLVGECLLPEDAPDRQAVACMRAIDRTDQAGVSE